MVKVAEMIAVSVQKGFDPRKWKAQETWQEEGSSLVFSLYLSLLFKDLHLELFLI